MHLGAFTDLITAALRRRWSLSTLCCLLTLAREQREMTRAELTSASRRCDNSNLLESMVAPLLRGGLVIRTNGSGCYLYAISEAGLRFINHPPVA